MLGKERALGDRRALMLYGPLYEKYEASMYWYEATIILNRTAFVLITLFISEPTMQVRYMLHGQAWFIFAWVKVMPQDCPLDCMQAACMHACIKATSLQLCSLAFAAFDLKIL